MEKFMFIFIGGNESELLTSPEAMQASMQEWFGWIEKLKKEGRYEGARCRSAQRFAKFWPAKRTRRPAEH